LQIIFSLFDFNPKLPSIFLAHDILRSLQGPKRLDKHLKS